MRGFVKSVLAVLCIGVIGGCTLPLKYLVGMERAVRIPQVVTHLEPSLSNNQIVISGKILLENPTESDLLLDKIYLSLKDGKGNQILQSEFAWAKPQLKSKGIIESPVELLLPLKILNQETVSLNLKTTLTYKVLGVKIPIESEIAVFHLAPLRTSLTGPLQVTIHTAINSDLLGNARVAYWLEIVNPFNVDLSLEDGEFEVLIAEKGSIGSAVLAKTLLVSRQPTKLQGLFLMQNIFRDVFIDEFIKGHAIHAVLTGKLRLPETDLFIPFKAEAVQEVDFSFFSHPKNK